MTASRAHATELVALVAAPLALLPLFIRPEAALALSVCGVVVWLACRSPGYALAVAGVPPIVFGIFGNNPLPEGAVSIAIACAVLLSVCVALQRQESVPSAAVLFGGPLVCSLILLCALVLRQPANPETNYGELKTGFFIANNLVLLIGGIFVGYSAARLRVLLLATLVISVGGASLLVLHVAGGGTQSILPVQLTFSEGDHSISMGRQMAVGVLVALAIVLGREDGSLRFLAAASLPLLVTALLASGSRGPIVGLLAGALALLLLGLPDKVARRRLLVLMAATTAAVVMVASLVPESSLVRSFSFASTDIESSSSGRTEMWAQSWRVITEHPGLGIGTGGFADINPLMIYPHNLVLEAGVELGLGGMLLIGAFLTYGFVRMGRAYALGPRHERVLVAATIALFVSAIANAMLSFALHTNWELWMWAGVGVGLSARLLKQREMASTAPRF